MFIKFYNVKVPKENVNVPEYTIYVGKKYDLGENGVTELVPNGTATRAETATIIRRIVEFNK